MFVSTVQTEKFDNIVSRVHIKHKHDTHTDGRRTPDDSKDRAERQRSAMKQEAQLMLTTGSTRLAVSRGQQTWYHSTCYI